MSRRDKFLLWLLLFAGGITTGAGSGSNHGAMSITGYAPVVSAVANATVITPSSGALALSGSTPVLVADVTSAPVSAEMTVTGNASLLDFKVLTGVSGLSLTGRVSVLTQSDTEFVAPVAADELILTGQTPTVSVTTQTSLEPLTASLELTPTTVGVTYTVTPTPVAASLALTGSAPTLLSSGAPVISSEAESAYGTTITFTWTTDVVSDTAVEAWTDAEGYAGRRSVWEELDSVTSHTIYMYDIDSIETNTKYNWQAVSRNESGVTTSAVRTVHTGTVIPYGSLVLTGAQARTGVIRDPVAADLAITGSAPGVSAEGATIIEPTTAELTLTGSAPVLSSSVTVDAVAGSMAFSGSAPVCTETTEYTRAPATASLVATGNAPTVIQNNLREVTSAELTITGTTPGVDDIQTDLIEVTTASLAITGSAPGIAFDGLVERTPATASLALTGTAPTVDVTTVFNTTITPLTVALVLTAAAPTNPVLVEIGDGLSTEAGAVVDVETGVAKKISAMSAAAALTGTEKWAIVQGGVTVYATSDQIKTYINS